MDEELYRRYSMPMTELNSKIQAGARQASKLVKYTWSDGSVTWCAYCGYCGADSRWVIHHSTEPLDDVLTFHVATHQATTPSIEGMAFSTGVGYVRASCQQCGWERDAHEGSGYAELTLAAEHHKERYHLLPGGCCSSGGCDCDGSN